MRAASDEQAIRRIDVSNLDILPVGEMHEAFNPDVLANGVFSSCMARWRQVYDFLVLDSPPVLPAADARIMAGYVDGVLLLVRATQNRRMEAMAAFGRARCDA